MNFRIITKNHVAASKIGPPKIDFRADGTQEFHPTAWELRIYSKNRFRDVSASIT